MDVLPAGKEQLERLRRQVEASLQEILPDAGEPPHRLHAAMRYAVLTPGKRIRPLLAMLTASCLGCPPSKALPAACALELIHAASLVFDDLPCMDDAPSRRGQPSVHVRYGEDVAILAGVALLNEAYAVIGRAEALTDGPRMRMVALLARTVGAKGLVGGQEKDLRGAGGDTPVSYLSQLHHEKTGVLFIASVEMGALAAEAPTDLIDSLRTFGAELGLAFQAMDDLADADELLTAKPVANMLSVMDEERLTREARDRVDRAKAALQAGGPRLSPMAAFVDLLLGREAA